MVQDILAVEFDGYLIVFVQMKDDNVMSRNMLRDIEGSLENMQIQKKKNPTNTGFHLQTQKLPRSPEVV